MTDQTPTPTTETVSTPAPTTPKPRRAERWFTITEAARIIGVSRHSILMAIQRHQRRRLGLPARRGPERGSDAYTRQVWLIRRSDLRAYYARVIRHHAHPRPETPKRPLP